jgi:hypothetical protein
MDTIYSSTNYGKRHGPARDACVGRDPGTEQDPCATLRPSVRDRSRHRRQHLLSAAAILLVLGIAGCGSGGTSVAHLHKVTTRTTPVATPETLLSAADRLAACMRAHGATNFPEPSASGQTSSATPGFDTNSPAVRTAAKDCRSLLPSIVSSLPPSLTREIRSDVLSAVACIRRHGLPNMPDPTFIDGLPRFPDLAKTVNIESQAFQSAFAACKSLLPGAGKL